MIRVILFLGQYFILHWMTGFSELFELLVQLTTTAQYFMGDFPRINLGSKKSLGNKTKTKINSIPRNTATGNNSPTTQGKNRFRFYQLFGQSCESTSEQTCLPENVIWTGSVCGDYVAIGDAGGRIILLKRKDEHQLAFAPYLEFQSHKPSFDYRKSEEIAEGINTIAFIPRIAENTSLLSANDNCIRLWRIQEAKEKTFVTSPKPVPSSSIQFPQVSKRQVGPQCKLQREFNTQSHKYNIHTLAPLLDQETFLSADDLMIHLWNYNHGEKHMGVLNLEPKDISTLEEVITCLHVHPQDNHTFIYGTSAGLVQSNDLRERQSLPSLTYQKTHETGNYATMLSSISDVQFSPCGRFVACRDFMKVNIWDIRNERSPMRSIRVNDNLQGCMHTLFQNDSFFDRWTVRWNRTGSSVVTGSYRNSFLIADRENSSSQSYVCFKPKNGEKNLKSSMSTTYGQYDFSRRCRLTMFHPDEDLLVVSTTQNLYTFKY